MTLFPLTRRRILFLAGFVFLSLTLFFLGSLPPQPAVSTSSPSANQLNVLLDTPVTLTFAAPVPPSLRRRLIITTTPPLFDSPRWSVDGTQVTLNPISPLTKNTSYLVSISYKNESLYSFNFTTNPFDAEDLRDQAAKQAADDRLYGQKTTDLIEKYPWYPSLPIITPQYYVFYSFIDSQFKIHLTVPSPSVFEQQQLEASALSSLRQIGVPSQNLKYLIILDSP